MQWDRKMWFRGFVLLASYLFSMTASGDNGACGNLRFQLNGNNGKTICQRDYVSYLNKSGFPVTAAYSINPGMKYREPFHRGYKSNSGMIKDVKDIKDMASSKKLDYGHLASEKINSVDVPSRFLDVNRVPMPRSINRKNGAWWKIENYELTMANMIGSIHVVSGTSEYDKNTPPDWYFKILWHNDIELSIAFLIPNNAENGSELDKYVTSVECIERAIHRKVFPDNSSLLRNSRETSAFSLNIWTQGGNGAKQCIQ